MIRSMFLIAAVLTICAAAAGQQPSTAVAGKTTCDPPRSAIDKNSQHWILPGVFFANGNAEVIHLSNKGKREESVTIERYSATGCLMEAIDKRVPLGGDEIVRLDLSQPTAALGWIHVFSKGKGIVASSSSEIIRGDTLTTVPRVHWAAEDLHRHLTKLNHRWTADLAAFPSVALDYFVNLSDHPVQVGVCQADRPGFFCKTMSHTLASRAQVAFRVDRSHRYLAVQSTPGYSASVLVNLVDGNKQAFSASSTITFDESALLEGSKQ